MEAKATSPSGSNGAEPSTVQIPDFVVRQVGALQLQLAAANEEIARLTNELAALKANKPEAAPEIAAV